jgi:hypothetical protein
VPRNRQTPLATKIAQTMLIVKQKIAVGIIGASKHTQRKIITTVSKATIGRKISAGIPAMFCFLERTRLTRIAMIEIGCRCIDRWLSVLNVF